MKIKQVLNIIFGLIFYVVGILGFLFSSLVIGLGSDIYYFSKILFWILYIIMPINILILPIFIKFALKKDFYISIFYSLLSVISYFIILSSANTVVTKYMSNFTKEKWSKYEELRYLMIDNFEEKYMPLNKKTEDITKILGETSSYKNNICYPIRNQWIKSSYYCLEYDENNLIKEIYIKVY